jgi:hypothetical protein
MSGVLPVATMYASLAAIALMLSRLAVQPASRIEHAAAFVVMLAVTWSISQYRDLSWQYEVQFPLLHLFALGALYALALAFSREGPSKYGWMAVALACDFLAVWSAGAGVFLTVPLLLLALWTMSPIRTLAIFLLFHALIVATFFAGYRINVSNRELHHWPGLIEYTYRLHRFVGLTLSASSASVRSITAWATLVCFLFLTVAMTAKSVFSRVASDRNLCVLLAFATFVLIEGALIGYTRRNVLDRHATMSTMFAAAMLAGLWRWLAVSGFPVLRWAVLGLAMLTIVITNDQKFEAHWRSHALALDEATAAARAGDFSSETLRYLTHHGWLPQALETLRRERLGPFAQVP